MQYSRISVKKSAMRMSSKGISHSLLHKLANAPHVVAQNNASWQQHHCWCWHVPLTLRYAKRTCLLLIFKIYLPKIKARSLLSSFPETLNSMKWNHTVKTHSTEVPLYSLPVRNFQNLLNNLQMSLKKTRKVSFNQVHLWAEETGHLEKP